MSHAKSEYLLGLGGLFALTLVAWLLGAPLLHGDSPAEAPAAVFTAGEYRVSLALTPPAPDATDRQLAISVQDAAAAPVADARVRVLVLHPGDVDASTPHFDVIAAPGQPGEYAAAFALAGDQAWPLLVEVHDDALGHADLALQLDAASGRIEALAATPEGVAHYTCPMHPSVKSAAAGQCPLCGMDLTPVTHADMASGSVLVDERRRQLIGLRTAAATEDRLTEEIRLYGTVRYDPAGTTDIALPMRGTVVEVFVTQDGVTVERGTPLFTVSSPELRAREEELLAALAHSQDGTGPSVRYAQRSLLALGLSWQDIEQLATQRRAAATRTIVAPVSGRVNWTQLLPGMGFESGQSLMQLVDPSRVQVIAAVYENDLPLLRAAMPARVRLPYLAGARMLPGTVTHLGAALRPHSHTLDAFVSLTYDGPPLPQNATADVFLDLVHEPRLLVPEEAVIHAGDTRVVFVDLGEGRLAPRYVETGRRNRDRVQVLEGLEPGDQVVTAGAFLLASESKLKTGIDQW